MNLKEIREWFVANYDASMFEQVSSGRIDKNLNRALCFYNSKNRTHSYINKLNLSTYTIKPITILLRYENNQTNAEIIISNLYDFFDRKVDKINKKKVKFVHVYENPIDLGYDDNGIIEFSLEIDLYIEKEGKKGME